MPGRPAKEGKSLGGNFRNFSHLFDERGYANASKGEKLRIREFLAREHSAPWFAALADSGQKHVIPFCPMNGPGRPGRVLFDEQLVHVPDDQALVFAMASLLTAGATKEEIGRGDYGSRAWQLCASELQAFERGHGSARHGAWFGLALWLAQRDEETVQTRLTAEKESKRAGRSKQGKVANPDSGGRSRGAKRVPRDAGGKRAEALGAIAEPASLISADDGNARGVGDKPLPEPPVAGPAQRELFGPR